jgi:flagellar hook-associated protein FlgK
MLRTLLDEVIGRLRQFGSHADGLEDENHRLQAELAGLLAARRENDDTFTIRQWDPSGTTLVDTIASAQNLHVARAAFPGVSDTVSEKEDDPADRRPRHRRAVPSNIAPLFPT